jgi:hypothetical protein
VETKPNCFLLPQSVLNFLHSRRLTGASVAEQPRDAEYDGKTLDLCGTASSSAKRNLGISHGAMGIHS